jgi:hypothetical protein
MATNGQRMELALEAWFSIESPAIRPSIRSYAKEYNVDRTTFSRRIDGGITRAQSYEHL